MKKILFRILFCLIVVRFVGAHASAQIYARDDAAAYTTLPNNSGWGFAPTTNGGFGFNPWVFRTNGLNASGFFVKGSETVIGTTNNKAWGMYANTSVGVKAAAFRSFTNSLPTNSVFKIKWRNLGIGNTTDNLGGFCLRNGNANATVDDANPLGVTTRFAFYYIGGINDNFRYYDAGGATATGLGFGRGPFELNLILLANDTYRLIVKNATGTAVITNYEGTLANSGTIDSLALFAYETDQDQIFNSLEISAVSLLPPEILNVQPANGSIYVLTTNVLSFDVVSAFSTAATNAITLTINGVNQTNLTFSGTESNRHVVYNPALVANLVYNGTIVAQDANGNRATNTFSFNTWSSANPFIEAEDYNYSAGGFIGNPFPNEYVGALGTNGIDYLEYDLTGTNNIYRPTDLPQIQASEDVDHRNYIADGYTDYNLGYIQRGEWQNYTRSFSNVTYDVYARIAGFAGNGVLLIEHLANATATSSNQPLAALGTCVAVHAGGTQVYRFVPLTDFFSQPVQIRFSGNHTLRGTAIGDDGSYNLTYLLLVPSTNAATLRPYISAGFPFPNAGGVVPDQLISFTIANRQTSVSAGTIKLYLDATAVTTTLSNNTAGTFVSYQTPTLLSPGVHTLRAEYSDGSVSQTNQWQFTVAALPIIPPAFAFASGSGASNGFNIHIAKATNNAALPTTSARAENHLAGLLIDPNTAQPYFNEAGGPSGNGRYAETNAINYNQAIGFNPSGLPGDVNFPYVAQTVDGYYTNDPNYISMEAIAYVQLSAGIHKWAVRSDDGFRLWFGTGANPTNIVVGEFEGGRGDGTPSEFEFIVQASGVYPMRLLYYEGTGFANVELYSINRSTGQSILINDQSNGNAVQSYRSVAAGVTLLNPAHSGSTTTFNFLTQAGKTHFVEYKNTLNDVSWQALTTIAGSGSLTNVTDNTATGTTRFYRVRSQ